MNNLNIPLKDFMVESFSLNEFESIVSNNDEHELLCNILSAKYDTHAILKVINYKIIKERIYFFLRWTDE